MDEWYRMGTSEVVSKLGANVPAGLSSVEAKQRLEQFGPNELIERGVKSPWRILWEQLTAIMVLILILAAIISLALKEYDDAIVIMIIVVLNAIIGFTQENRAEKAIAALKKMSVPSVRVRRNNQIEEISARDLVPGDLMLLQVGNMISTDGRLIESTNLQTNEAALTGESNPVEKSITSIERRDLPVADRLNMVHMGTVVTYGRGMAVVTSTGMKTELGKIANLLQTVEREPTPLQRRLDHLGKVLAGVTLAIIVVVFLLGLFRGEDLRLMFLTGISMAVAAIPEGLPAVVTITLALGSRRMLKRNALIRKLPAVETLGSITVICSDKTGTLTENRMQVTMLDVAGSTQDISALLDRRTTILDADYNEAAKPLDRSLGILLKAAALCNDAILQDTYDDPAKHQAVGDPTEGALLVAAARFGIDKNDLEQEWPRVAEAPFTSERKRMTTVHRAPGQGGNGTPWHRGPFVAFTKGAVDGLLEVVRDVWVDDQLVPLNTTMRERIDKANSDLAEQGQRVLGIAFRSLDKVPNTANEAEVECELTFIGLIGMLDPPRSEVLDAVSTSRSAGIRPIMITGDHPLTAQYIANELRISSNSHSLTGQSLSRMSDQELQRKVEEIAVFARVSPEHKLNIVEALQANGHVVAMTGDGVNDAPALKKADIGVAMGITGTDVSKEAADMVLLDDNFATIVSAVEEGRVIYDNIRKFIKYILSSNTGEILVMLLAPFLGMPLPLLPLQILWINLVTDGLPGLALAVEPAERGTMFRRPYLPGESVLSRGIGRQIIWIGTLMGLVSLGVGYGYWLVDPGGSWRTIIFTTLTLAQMGNALAIRSGKDSFFTIGILTNRSMLTAVLLTFVLQLAVIYVPFLQNAFTTTALTASELIVCLVSSTVVFWAVELEKWIIRKRTDQDP